MTALFAYTLSYRRVTLQYEFTFFFYFYQAPTQSSRKKSQQLLTDFFNRRNYPMLKNNSILLEKHKDILSFRDLSIHTVAN